MFLQSLAIEISIKSLLYEIQRALIQPFSLVLQITFMMKSSKTA